MAKRISEVARVQQYFDNAPIEAAQVMLEIVSGIIKRRNGGVTPTVPRKQRSDKGKTRQGELIAVDPGVKE